MQTLKSIAQGMTLLVVAASLTANAAGLDDRARHDCLLEPLIFIELGSPVQGVLKSVNVGRSDNVEAGQVLAELDASVEEASLAQARARAHMDGEILAREADLALSNQTLSRLQELFEKNMASFQERDEAHAKQQIAKMALQQAMERKRIAQHESRWAQTVVERRKIRSPIDGVVVERTALPGEFVYENPVLTLAQLDPLRVEVILPASMYGQLEKGMRASVFTEISSDGPHLATVTAVDQIIDTGSSTFGAELQLPNREHLIPGGQKCEIVFHSAADGERKRTAQRADQDQLALTR